MCLHPVSLPLSVRYKNIIIARAREKNDNVIIDQSEDGNDGDTGKEVVVLLINGRKIKKSSFVYCLTYVDALSPVFGNKRYLAAKEKR